MSGIYKEGSDRTVVNRDKQSGVMIYNSTTQKLNHLNTDGMTDAISIIEYEHHEIHAGSHFIVSSYIDMDISHVLQVTFVTPNTGVWAHWTWQLAAEAETIWQIYEGATITNALANVLTPINNNRNSSTASAMTLRYEDHADLANANANVSVAAATLLESGIISAGKGIGDFDRRDHELILKQNTVYSLRATASSAGYLDFLMTWYEHTSKT